MTAPINTKSQVKALLWEEGRVGGSIAGMCLVVGLMMLGQAYMVYGTAAWIRDEFLSRFAGLGVPLIVGLLIILNPDYSGHLVGGFSKRILRLPVQTSVAVAVSLFARIAIVFFVAAVTLGVSGLLFVDVPGFGAVCAITLAYIAAQIIDWLRGPVRGLTSLIAIGLLVFVIGWLTAGTPLLSHKDWMYATSGPVYVLSIVAVVVAVVAYAIAAAAVHADRIGRRYGVPEIWEWPARISFAGPVNTRPFRSPMTAQIWFELRRAKFLLPLVALLFVGILFAAGWLTGNHVLQPVAEYGVWGAVLFGAAVHGIVTRVIGFRKRSRTLGYELLQPIPDAQLANARIAAAVLLLVPTLLAAVVFHYGVAGRYVIAEMLPKGLHLGVISPRETVWMLISRGLLVGTLACLFLTIGTQLFRILLASFIAIMGLTLLSDGLLRTHILIPTYQSRRLDTLTSLMLAALVVIVVLIAVRVLRRGLVARRTLFFWMAAWLLLAWLFRYVLVTMWVPQSLPVGQQFLAVLTALGCATPLPLMCFAVLLDIRRRRSTTTRYIDPDQHQGVYRSRRNAVGLAAAALMALAILWLGWPAEPAYLNYRRSMGYPPTLKGANAWYPEPPAGTNAATEYLKVIERSKDLNQKYESTMYDIKKIFMPSRMVRTRYFRPKDPAQEGPNAGSVYYNEKEGPSVGKPLDKRDWNATTFYWNRVTSKIMPQLEEIAQRDTRTARYPVDLDLGYEATLEHLALLRSLSRQCSIDTLHWTIVSKPSKAIDSVVADFALTKSLSNEPIIISQLVRFAIIGMTTDSIGTLMNRSVPAEADLLRLQQACENALPPVSEGMALDRAMIFEAAVQVEAPFQMESNEQRGGTTLRNLWPQLVFPAAGSRMAFTFEMNESIAAARLPWPDFQRWDKERESSGFYSDLGFVSPYLAMLLPATGRAYEAEWRARMNLQNARVALAVERYRLANKKLPARLGDLVPEFLSDIPRDYYAGYDIVQYRAQEDSAFVVYSLGPNGTDEHGEEIKDRGKGDITFKVLPMSKRTAPQVAEE